MHLLLPILGIAACLVFLFYLYNQEESERLDRMAEKRRAGKAMQDYLRHINRR